MKRTALVLLSLCVASAPAFAAKPCEELKSEIAAKIEANGVTSYTLNVVGNDDVGSATVVGSCDGGTKKITYERTSGMSGDSAAPASSASAAAMPAAKTDPSPTK